MKHRVKNYYQDIPRAGDRYSVDNVADYLVEETSVSRNLAKEIAENLDSLDGTEDSFVTVQEHYDEGLMRAVSKRGCEVASYNSLKMSPPEFGLTSICKDDPEKVANAIERLIVDTRIKGKSFDKNQFDKVLEENLRLVGMPISKNQREMIVEALSEGGRIPARWGDFGQIRSLIGSYFAEYEGNEREMISNALVVALHPDQGFIRYERREVPGSVKVMHADMGVTNGVLLDVLNKILAEVVAMRAILGEKYGSSRELVRDAQAIREMIILIRRYPTVVIPDEIVRSLQTMKLTLTIWKFNLKDVVTRNSLIEIQTWRSTVINNSVQHSMGNLKGQFARAVATSRTHVLKVGSSVPAWVTSLHSARNRAYSFGPAGRAAAAAVVVLAMGAAYLYSD